MKGGTLFVGISPGGRRMAGNRSGTSDPHGPSRGVESGSWTEGGTQSTGNEGGGAGTGDSLGAGSESASDVRRARGSGSAHADANDARSTPGEGGRSVVSSGDPGWRRPGEERGSWAGGRASSGGGGP